MFCATTSRDLVTLTFDILTLECLMYSGSHARPTYQFLLSCDYRLLSYELLNLITFPLTGTAIVLRMRRVT